MVFTCITTVLAVIGFWISIPFTDALPEYWYLALLIILLAITTQITMDSEQVQYDGSFSPPPTYMLPQKYRVMLAYVNLVINIIIVIQMYIYYGISDITKKTIVSRYILERFGGWYEGNKADFLFEWGGVIDCIIKIYLLYLQSTFQACEYGLPPSWNA
jgi:cobalamin synthase